MPEIERLPPAPKIAPLAQWAQSKQFCFERANYIKIKILKFAREERSFTPLQISWAHSSVVERYLHTIEVRGSIPRVPTIKICNGASTGKVAGSVPAGCTQAILVRGRHDRGRRFESCITHLIPFPALDGGHFLFSSLTG